MLRTCMIYFLTKWNLQQQGITVTVSTIKAAHPEKLGYMLLKNTSTLLEENRANSSFEINLRLKRFK